jgi:hypothetical protein
MKSVCRKDTCRSILNVALFNPGAPKLINDEENVTCIQSGTLVIHKEELNYVICWKTDRTGDHYVK